jgi:UDP-N-acetylmuramoyl-L-alanyl-D-glutamate--2,6-diaminopimelate ligase
MLDIFMTSLQAYLEHLAPLTLAFRGDPATPIAGAAADSRAIRPGWLFVAIPGRHDDGAKYLPQALAAGAAAVVAVTELEVPAGVALIRVSDAYAAAGRVAEILHGQPGRDLCLFGVTGTNGKTTTAYLLRAILAVAGRRAGMIGTVVYDTGGGAPREADRTTPTPFEAQALLAEMRAHGLRDAVLEVSSHSLAQRRLGAARFAGVIFTNLTGDHLDYHHTMDEYFAAKQLLFTEGLPPGAPAVINTDDPWGARLAATLAALPTPAAPRVIPFGRDAAARAGAHLCELRTGADGTTVTLEFAAGVLPGDAASRRVELQSPLVGVFNAYNLAGAAVLALAAGVPEAAVRGALATCTGAPGRLEPVRALAGWTAFVDYAHTDDALDNVLRTLRDLRPRRLIVLFGCGGDRDRSKRPRMGAVAARYADVIVLTSDNPRTEDPAAILRDIQAGIPTGIPCQVLADRRAAIRAAVAAAGPGDFLLVAGKGHEPYQECNGVKTHFNDREELESLGVSKGTGPFGRGLGAEPPHILVV